MAIYKQIVDQGGGKTTKGSGGGNKKIPNVKDKSASSTTKKTNTSAATQTPAPSATANVADTDIVTWSGNGGISFYVKPNVIQGLKDLTIKAAADTEDKEDGGEKYTSKKNNGALQITIKAELNGYLGADVETMAMNALSAARTGEAGYFYCYGKKLFGNQFMMTDAQVANIGLNSRGVWNFCELTMTLKQCSKGDGSAAGGGGGKNKISGWETVQKIGSTVKSGAEKLSSAVEGIKNMLGVTNSAKQQSIQTLNNSKRKE